MARGGTARCAGPRRVQQRVRFVLRQPSVFRRCRPIKPARYGRIQILELNEPMGRVRGPERIPIPSRQVGGPLNGILAPFGPIEFQQITRFDGSEAQRFRGRQRPGNDQNRNICRVNLTFAVGDDIAEYILPLTFDWAAGVLKPWFVRRFTYPA
jgi:hypothetical protein